MCYNEYAGVQRQPAGDQRMIVGSLQLDILSLIGLVIICAYLASKGMQRIGVPQVVGFILVGVLLGSSFLDIVPLPLVRELAFVSEIALALIGFDMGSHLRLGDLRRLGGSILAILLCEGLGAFVLVSSGIYLLTRSVPTALVFGALASATAPAATVDVLHEYHAEGPLTTTLMAVVGLDDALSLLLFSVAATIAESQLSGAAAVSLVPALSLVLQEIGGATLLGIVVGVPFQELLNRLEHEHAVYGFVVGVVIFVAGLANSLGVSLILSLMTMGVVVANLRGDNSLYVRRVVERVGPVIYVLFFALVGARLQVHLLPAMGLVGLTYLVMRTCGKLGGAWFGSVIGGAEPQVRNYLGFGLLSQAGVAIGLALSVAHRFDGYGVPGTQLGAMVISVITATTFVVQIVGPVMLKFAVSQAGELGKAVPVEERHTPRLTGTSL
jgi:Kef-type K+ transport system membrane component KefB